MTTTAHTSLPSLDDIVFEGRNKAYGAYVLRRVYGRNVTRATLLGIALMTLLLAIPLAIQRFWPAPVAAPDIIADMPVVELMREPVLPSATPPAPPARATVVVRPPAAQFPTRIVRDELAKPVPPTDDVVPVDEPALVGPTAQDGTGGVALTGPAGSGHDSAAKPAAPPVTQPFVHVEEMPEFAGGSAALGKYLQRHLHYPAQALRAGVEGKVFISFVVNADGTITDVNVLKGLGYGTEEEAARVIRQMPAWKPGYQNHHAVPVRYTLPITFQYQ